MRHRLLVAVTLLALFIVGIGVSYALSAATSTTGTVTACVTVTSPAHTIYDNTRTLGTIPRQTASACRTVTYTTPDPVTTTVVTTVTDPGTTTAPPPPTTTAPPPTTTAPPPTTTTPPPPPSGGIAPGQSWQAAYDAAPAFGTVRVLPGNHGSPTLVGTKPVTFLGDEGAVVGKMPGDCPCTFDNIDIDTGSTHGQYSASEPTSANITWRNVNVSGSFASVHTWDSATNFRWLGGSLVAPGTRNCSDGDGQPLWLNADGATIDGVSFGVFDSGDCSPYGAFHMEAIRVQGASDISILNTTFSAGSDTGSGHIFITTTSPSDRQPARFRVENTIFPPLVGSYAIQIHSNVQSYQSYVYKNNRFDQPILDPAPYVNLVACGNTGTVDASWKTPC